MLVRFSVENYLSFKDKTEFNMLTGNPRRLPHHVYKHGDLDLLKMAAIYGANGAGKSNLVNAFIDFRNLVCAGPLFIVENGKKFRLNTSNSTLPIGFEVEFIIENTLYFYSISIDNFIILNERLSLPKTDGTEEMIFERQFLDNKIKIDFNEKYKKNEQDKLRIKLYEEELLDHDETLFFKLNEAREGFDTIKKAFVWFSRVRTINPNSTISNLILYNPYIHDFVKDYIQKFNTGISSFKIFTYSFEQFFGENNQQIKDKIKEELKNKPFFNVNNLFGYESAKSKTIAVFENNDYKIKSLFTYHLNEKKEEFQFQPEEESDGSVRLWDILTAIYFVIHEPMIVLVDEIERSIHPYLLKQLLTKLSENKEIKGQLVFTTHESNLLDQEIFRQDEIWFAEKNTEGATELYPMSDFDIRYDLDIRKGYLNGRFGAIPFLGDFKDLNWKADAE